MGKPIILEICLATIEVCVFCASASAALEKKAKMLLLLLAILKSEENKKTLKSEQKIAPALNWLNKNYQKAFSSEYLAELCDLSQSQLRRLFKSLLGKTPMEYRNDLRITAAAGMLLSGDFNVSEVAFAVGFEDIYAFSHAFKKVMGVSPSRFKEDALHN